MSELIQFLNSLTAQNIENIEESLNALENNFPEIIRMLLRSQNSIQEELEFPHTVNIGKKMKKKFGTERIQSLNQIEENLNNLQILVQIVRKDLENKILVFKLFDASNFEFIQDQNFILELNDTREFKEISLFEIYYLENVSGIFLFLGNLIFYF